MVEEKERTAEETMEPQEDANITDRTLATLGQNAVKTLRTKVGIIMKQPEEDADLDEDLDEDSTEDPDEDLEGDSLADSTTMIVAKMNK